MLFVPGEREVLIEKIARAIAGLNYCNTDAMVLPCVTAIGPKGFPFVPNGIEPVPVWMLYRSEASVAFDAMMERGQK